MMRVRIVRFALAGISPHEYAGHAGAIADRFRRWPGDLVIEEFDVLAAPTSVTSPFPTTA